MKPENTKKRTLVLGGIFLAVTLVFILRFMDMQIVNGKMYDALVNRGVNKTQVVEAARGEILDRNGQILATNQVSYNIVIEKAFFPTGQENETILRLIEITSEQNVPWIDNLPITETAPFKFKEGMDAAVARLKKFVGVNEYASAESVMHWLTEMYGLEDYAPEDLRKIAGVRYEMAVKDFSYSYPYIFAKDVPVKLSTIIKERGFEVPGVDVTLSAKRSYPDGTLAPHIIGLTGPIYSNEELETLGEGYRLTDHVGKTGIESYGEANLKGTTGEKVVYINKSGTVTEVIETVDPIPGDNVYLTLDKDLQKVADQALESQILYMQQFAPAGRGREAYAGTAVAIEIKTGEVLALSNYPSYDLNTYTENYSELAADTKAKPLFNRALQGSYMPGSIFKPVVAYAGKVNGVIERDTTVFCGHVYTRFTDYQPTCLGTHANINVITALRESCNIFFYDVGYRTGLDEVNKYARLFGLGVPPNFELATATGTLTTPENVEARGEVFNPGDILQASIGQKDDRFTPIQLANYVATIGGRGTRMQPSIIKQITSFDGEEVKYTHTPTVASQMPNPPEMFDDVIEGMVACARIGSGSYYSGYLGRTFANYPINVAAKTGTPEEPQHFNSTFIIYGPVEDPQIAIFVLIEDGWHGYTGVPVAMAIMDEYFGLNKPAEQPPEPEEPAKEPQSLEEPEPSGAQ